MKIKLEKWTILIIILSNYVIDVHGMFFQWRKKSKIISEMNRFKDNSVRLYRYSRQMSLQAIPMKKSNDKCIIPSIGLLKNHDHIIEIFDYSMSVECQITSEPSQPKACSYMLIIKKLWDASSFTDEIVSWVKKSDNIAIQVPRDIDSLLNCEWPMIIWCQQEMTWKTIPFNNHESFYLTKQTIRNENKKLVSNRFNHRSVQIFGTLERDLMLVNIPRPWDNKKSSLRIFRFDYWSVLEKILPH